MGWGTSFGLAACADTLEQALTWHLTAGLFPPLRPDHAGAWVPVLAEIVRRFAEVRREGGRIDFREIVPDPVDPARRHTLAEVVDGLHLDPVIDGWIGNHGG